MVDFVENRENKSRFKVFDCHIVYCKYVVCLLLAMYAGICRTLYDAPKLHIIFRIPKYFTSNNIGNGAT